MSGEKRWGVDEGGDLLWSEAADGEPVWITKTAPNADLAAHAALVADVRAAARLRSLAAIYEQPLNRDKTFTFTGRELAAMLKWEGRRANRRYENEERNR